MTDKVLKTIEDCHMLTECHTLGIGLSGGADSVCLAHVLLRNKEKLGINSIKGIHIHHGIRGEEADRDFEFVRNFCEKYGIEFVSYCVDVPTQAKETGESIEECARRIRYECFEKSGCDKVATAHNLNDNVETFIFNLTRGTSLSGLCGIPYVRDIYIRPLLECSREEIEKYLLENQLEYVVDSTNLSCDYTRNKIRHNVLPVLFEINPSFDKVFLRCQDSLNTSKDYISKCAGDLVEKSRCDGYYDCKAFADCHDALKYQAVSLILKEHGVKNISREHIDAVLGLINKSGTVSLSGNIKVNVERNKLFFGEFSRTEYFEIPIKKEMSEISTPIGSYLINIFNKKDLQNFNKQDIDFFIDYDKISNSPTVRNRKDGDGYQLPDRPYKTFKKLFNENKISVYKRDKMLVLSDDNGIVWTEFFGVSKAYKVDETTENFIKIKKVGKNND